MSYFVSFIFILSLTAQTGLFRDLPNGVWIAVFLISVMVLLEKLREVGKAPAMGREEENDTLSEGGQ